eukprot:TRINITY_DN14970_c0_g1_i1.p1 TRINITY_DN14970_c0_g1~~TRINITY_DN14970_c0_g1_i1.p1  ORF type:complete len:736 (+),score=241.09 TRINITY_DN14970_c0_g1_i1:66-2273(+)
MRIMVKGGVWKNTEDEILKAAVMKYGKNQWARISSLIVRKTAKQCKARWQEWLDPSIKKTEWSREEEEKLLHLAKIMPNQWKTISPMVGRTASQCLEHYERLLDAAQEKEVDGEDDPRRLRPGEIDPNPESKPARPDPIDMDEDEKEMLSEARARLANTKGKKAKRKAREKQLDEARRLAMLQKRRELKAAGIELPKPKRKIKGIDYNKEVPFQKKPPPGFFEVDWDAETPKAQFNRPTLDSLEGKRRRESEEESRKKDAKKQKNREKFDLPGIIARISEINDPKHVILRTKLSLPAPTLDDADLEELSKLTADEQRRLTASGEGSAVTQSLLTNYASTPLASQQAQRTPLPSRTPMREDFVRKEAQNLIALTAQQTPLMGGDNPELHDSDFKGVKPPNMDAKTPNAMATPLRNQGGFTPQRKGTSNALVLADAKSSLRSALKNLPAPKDDFQIELPELPDELTSEPERELEADTSDIIAAQERRRQELEDIKLNLRSEACKRDLPRPHQLTPEFLKGSAPSTPNLRSAQDLIHKEMIALIRYEAAEFPYKFAHIPESTADYHNPSEEAIALAKIMIGSEKREMLAGRELDLEGFSKAYEEIDRDVLFMPSNPTIISRSTANKKDIAEYLADSFQKIKGQMGKEAMRAKKLGEKANIYNAKHIEKSKHTIQEIQSLLEEIQKRSTTLDSLRSLQSEERKAVPFRLDQLRELVQFQDERESELQKRYASLVSELSA